MSGATSALYEPLIKRDLDAIPVAARTFLESHSEDELWIAIARFAVLAYAPSQHAKRAVMAVRAAGEVGLSFDLIVACARYAAESRQPWSEPPILEPPSVDDAEPLNDAIASGDRLRAERWLAAHLNDAHARLRERARGDALLMLDTAIALERSLGEKGRFALLRMVTAELFTPTDHPTESLDVLIDRAIESRGAIDDVRAVFIRAVEDRQSCLSAVSGEPGQAGLPVLHSYPLARDYAQTLIAQHVARTLPARAGEFLAAVHHNLEHGESYAEWSFA
jgi:hypothetical protein